MIFLQPFKAEKVGINWLFFVRAPTKWVCNTLRSFMVGWNLQGVLSCSEHFSAYKDCTQKLYRWRCKIASQINRRNDYKSSLNDVIERLYSQNSLQWWQKHQVREKIETGLDTIKLYDGMKKRRSFKNILKFYPRALLHVVRRVQNLAGVRERWPTTK